MRLMTCAALVGTALAGGCASTQKSSFEGELFSEETRALEAQLSREAEALGSTQAAIGMAGMWDPTGAASLVTIPAGMAAREAWRASADARMEAQLKRDEEASYRRWGMTPDGRPSGARPGPHAEP